MNPLAIVTAAAVVTAVGIKLVRNRYINNVAQQALRDHCQRIGLLQTRMTQISVNAPSQLDKAQRIEYILRCLGVIPADFDVATLGHFGVLRVLAATEQGNAITDPTALDQHLARVRQRLLAGEFTVNLECRVVTP